MERAAAIAVREVRAFLAQNASVEKVLLVCFGDRAHEVFRAASEEADRCAGRDSALES
jgi:O-acetyl-ADP-ribose deacetylase (regulator of RNase III)